LPLNILTPVTFVQGNVYNNFGFFVRNFVFELGARVQYNRTDGQTDEQDS